MGLGVSRTRRLRVAFQGEQGAFSQIAIQQLLGDSADVVPCTHFEAVFQALAGRRADAAVVPIENTLHGSVHENYDLLLRYKLPILAETNVRIVHNLIGPPGTGFHQVRRVYSHPVALNQCLEFFSQNTQLERVSHYDTAGSVKMLAEQRPPGAAAIASKLAAKLYGCRILRASIEDDRRNFTRFFLLRRPGNAARAKAPAARGYKTSLVFTTRNIPGALFRALSAFALRDLNLAKIESRPLRGKPWEYLFYVDFLGHVDDPVVKNALGHLGELADLLRVLGCYPRSK